MKGAEIAELFAKSDNDSLHKVTTKEARCLTRGPDPSNYFISVKIRFLLFLIGKLEAFRTLVN